MYVRLLLIICIACIFIIYALLYWSKQIGLTSFNVVADSAAYDVSSVFDTCPLVLYNHLDPELLKFYHPRYNPKANCRIYDPLTELVNGTVRMKKKAKGFKCKARCILPVNDRTYNVSKWINLPSEFVFKCDIVETECSENKKIESFLHMQIYETPGGKVSPKHDVYILILDSVSTFMSKRSLPKTIKYLKEQMGAVQMEFLNKVGDNSRPNGFVLAFGKSIEGGSRDLVGLPPLIPDWNNAEICKKYLDNQSYHLFDYEKEGYKTMVAMDYGVGIMYWPNCYGFKRREADHLWRPFDLRRAQSKIFKKPLDDSCSERHLEMLEYLEKFMQAYPGVPKIAQVWATTLAHDKLKDLYHADDHFIKFFQKNRNIIDKSFFFMAADHGPRREGIGKVRLGQYENLNPFLIVTIPAVYQNTSMHAELKKKAHELMTHFDVHATLMDILKLQPNVNFLDIGYRDMMPLSKGSSLLRKWRGQRNCRTLPIPSQYCICQYNKTEVKETEMKVVLGQYFASQLNLHLINEHLDKKCQMQHYNRSLRVTQIKDRTSTLYEVAVYLSPSNGLFSGMISLSEAGLKMSSGFARLDRYGKQGNCLRGSPDQPLCHCIGTKEP